MKISYPQWLYHLFIKTTDMIYQLIPQPVPSQDKINNCKLIAHRGVHDNADLLENTLLAFDKAKDLGLDGIELDIRWTKDNIAVVIHDDNCNRVFGKDIDIADTSFETLQNLEPRVPSLENVIGRYGDSLHLMIELKEAGNAKRLQALLAHLTPVKNYHFLSLDPSIFESIDFVPAKTFMPVAEVSVQPFVDLIVDKGYAGLGGFYLFISKKVVGQLNAKGYCVGTGFIASKNALFRELNRGVEWVFTNHAAKLKAILDLHKNID